MSFLGTQQLTELLESAPIIAPFDKINVKNGAYELCLGEQVFLTDSEPRKIQNLSLGQEIYIAPGQFALLLTEEIVDIPQDKIAFISIKATIKFNGLVNVSGFHVDPGFKGKLLFSVYNAGPFKIPLRRGQKCFPIWLAELSGQQDYRGEHEDQLQIPLGPVAALSQGDLASPNSLLEKIVSNYKALEAKITTTDTAQGARINLLEKDQKAMDYLIKTAFGIVVVIFFKFVFDWFLYKQGLDTGASFKQKEIATDSSLNRILREKRTLLIEIDSLQKIKDSLTTKN